MLKFSILRSHFNDLDIVWLANCKVVDQTLFYRLGYFAPYLPDTINLLAGINEVPILVELPPQLIYQEDHRVLYSPESFQLKLLSS
jgi:hypothetical protein